MQPYIHAKIVINIFFHTLFKPVILCEGLQIYIKTNVQSILKEESDRQSERC